MKRNKVIMMVFMSVFFMFNCVPSYAFLGWGKAKTTDEIMEQTKVLIEQKEYLKAIDQLEDVLEEEPDRADARAFLGYCYFWTGDYRRAEFDLKQALRVDPNNVELIQRYVYTLQKLNRLDEAFGIVQELSVRTPNKKPLQDILTNIKQGQIEDYKF
ncbi:MAG: tetratricopeptide repeat protein [Candidatus Omnitrophica bacterium]|nr:tetratricopeptide repeat protein [Candidatus Omnitrophota bacterium]